MDFIKTSVVLTLLIAGIQCIDIRIQETSGDHDDGVIKHGSSFSVYCSVPEMKTGRVAVWLKKQGDAMPLIVGMGETIMDLASRNKFVATSVYSGDDEENGDLIAYILNLKDGLGAEYVDSGEYGCVIARKLPETGGEVDGDVVWESLEVLDPVDTLKLYSVKKDQVENYLEYYKEYEDGQDIRMSDGEELYFRCVAVNSNPPANVRVFLGDKELTDQFTKVVSDPKPIDTDDIPGGLANLAFAYDVTLTSDKPIKIKREDNKRPFTCNATIPEHSVVKLSVLPTMLYGPEVECHNAVAEYRERLAKVQCIVRATPQLSKERYYYNETTNEGPLERFIDVGQKVGQMHFKKEKGKYEDQFVYTLEFSHVPEQSFRQYNFTGEYRSPMSDKGENVTGQVRLELQNPGAVQEQDNGSAQHFISFFTILLIFFHL